MEKLKEDKEKYEKLWNEADELYDDPYEYENIEINDINDIE